MADYKVDIDVNVNDSKLNELESKIKSLEKNNNIKVAVELDDSKLNSSLNSKLKSQTVVVNADSSGVQKTIGGIQTALKNAAKSGQIKLQFDDNGTIKGINNIQQTIKGGEVVQLRVDGIDAVGNAFSAVQKLNAETDSPIEIKVNAKQLEQTKTIFQQTEADYKELLSIIDSAGKKKADLFGLDEGTEKARLLNEELAEMDKRADKLLTRSLDNFTDKQFNAIKQHEADSDYKLNWKIADAIDKDDLAQARSAVQQTETDYKELLSIVKDINQTKIQLIGLDESSEKAKFLNSELERLESRANTIATRSFDNFTDKQLNGLNSIDKKLVSNLGKTQATAIDKANIASTTEEYKRLISTMKEIGSIRIQLQGLDEGSARAETLTKRLENLKVEAKDIFNSNTFSSNQMNGINNLTKNMDNALQDAKDKIIDVKAEIANGITKEYNAGDFSAQISTINRQMAELGDRAEFVEEPYRKLLSTHRELAEAVKSQDVNAITEAEERRAAALDKVNSVLTIQKNLQKEDIAAEKEVIATEKLRQRSDELSARMGTWITENSAAAKQFGSQIDILRTQLKSCDAVQFDNINHQFKMIQSSAKEAGLTGMSFGDKLKAQFSKLTSYFSAATIMMAGMQAGRQAFQNVLDIDTKMTELKRVTDYTSGQYSDVYDTLTASAQKYGATLTDLISQTADWSRAGFNDPDTAAGLAKITSIYQHIADLDADTSMENLLTAYKGFENELKEAYGNDADAAAMHIADIYNEIDNNYATTAADIGEAVKRSASALSLAGNTLEETAGMVTGITEVTQDPEKAGNSLKVLSMRLRGMKGELQDLGEETDENVENLSQMQGKVFNLTHGKVNIFDNAGDFKSTYEIMQGIADVYDDLTDTDKADLLETIAGKNRANEVAALIQNWDRVAAATESAENSTGSAMAEQEKYANSLQGRLNSLTSSLQTISNSALDSGFLKGLVSGATDAINILNKLIDTFGIIPTVAGVAGAAMSLSGKKFFDVHIDEKTNKLKFFGETAKNVGSSVKEAFSSAGQVAGEVFNKINTKLGNGKVFNFNNLSSNQINKAKSFDIKQLSTDVAKLEELKSKIAEDVKSGAMPEGSELEQQRANIENMLDGVSDKARELAETIPLTSKTIGEFSRSSLEAAGIVDKNASAMANAKSIIEHYNTSFSGSADKQKEFANAISSFNPQLGNYLSGLKSGEASLAGYGAQLVAAAAKTVIFEAATLALNAALTMGISMLVSAGVSALMSWINRADELSDKIDDITTKYKQQKEELQNSKKTIDDVSDSYEKLSQGVNPTTNDNVTLSNDEYKEYIDIVNQIADTFPTLVSGYDAQGNAILSCAGNVDKLNAAYKEMANNNYDDVLKEANNFIKDFKNKSDDLESDGMWGQLWDSMPLVSNNMRKDSYDTLKDLISDTENFDDKMSDLKSHAFTDWDLDAYDKLNEIAQAFENAGIERKNFFESDGDFVKRAITENKKVAKQIVSDYEEQMKAATEDMQTATEAYFGKAFLNGKYSNISKNMQNAMNQMIPNLGYDYFSQFKNAEDMYDSLDKILTSVNDVSGKDKTFETYFDLQAKVNNGECTVGEYVNNLNDVSSVIDELDIDKNAKKALKLSLQLDDNDIKKQYTSFKNSLTKSGVGKDVAKQFTDGLTATELEAAVKLKADAKIDLKKSNLNDIKKQIQDEAKYLEAMNFKIDIDAETDSLDKLNSALAESKSATGLTADSIDALKSRYQGLAGYNPSKLFEETSNGIRMNTQEYTKLEQAYAQSKLKDTTSNLETLKGRYDELTKAIAQETDEKRLASLVSDQEDIRQQINDLGELAAQYEGLASKYNAWQNAESAGSDRDMYENVLKGFEEVDDELSRGWLDDASKAFIDMFSYDQLNSIDDYTNRWKTLGNTIDGTTYSVKDFFTQNKDGESTNDGVYNFLEAVDQLGQGNIKRGEDGEIISFDFGVNGEEAIAKTMGISKELVQIIERAAEDAGFVINMDGTYTNFADLQKAAVESNKKINELAQSSEKLKKLGLDNYTFHFDSTDAETVFNDLNKAKEMLDTFRRDDGTIDLSVDGAQDALNIASTLQAAYDKLADPVYMQLDASQVDDSMKDALSLMQEYRTDQKTLNQMKLKGVDTSELEKSMDTIVDDIYKLSDNTKTEMGIDVSVKDPEKQKANIEEQLNSGELTVDATVDLQVEANDTLNDIKLLMEHQAGLITDAQLKIGLELDTSSVDDYTEKEATKIVKFLPENTDFLDNLGLDDDKKKVVVDFVSDNADFLNDLDLKDGEKEILLKYVAENPDLLKDLDKDQKKIAIDFVVNNQDILDKLDDEKQRKVVVDFVAKNEGILDDLKTDEEKEVVVNFIANNEDVLNGLDDEKQRKVIIDFVAKNPNFFDSLGLNDDEKKVAIEFVAKNQDILKDLDYGEKQVVVKLVAKNPNLLDGLEDTQKQVVVDFVKNTKDIDSYTPEQLTSIVNFVKNSSDVDDYTPAEKQAIAKYAVDGGDVNNYQPADRTAIVKFLTNSADPDSYTPEQKQAIVKFLKDSGEVDGYQPGQKEAIARFLKDSSQPDSYQPNNKNAIASYGVDSSMVDSYTPPTKTGVVNYVANVIGSVAGKVKQIVSGGGANGTAHVNGTAFAQGNWGTKENGTALMGELGQEVIVRDGHFFTVGDNGAEFVKYKKGDIVFNHKQSEELFKNGYVTSGGGRGKALVSGTAFGRGSGGIGRANKSSSVKTSSYSSSRSRSSSSSSSSNSNSNSSANKEAEKTEETLDWIETALNRVERAISRLDKTATSTYKNWTKRGTALNDQISQTRREIDLQNQAYNRYIQQANSVGLDAGYAAKVRDGTIDIEKITDEGLNNKISEYKQWYEKALDCLDAIDDLRESESKLYEQRFENVSTKYDGYLGVIQHEKDMLDEFVSQAETAGYITSGKYYDAMSANAKKQQEELKKQRDEMISELNNAVNSGTIEKYSESWYSMVNSVDDVTKSIEECNTSLLEYEKNLRELDWQVFDLIQDKISKVADESEFLINLMSNKKLYEDNGQLTDEGMASMGQYGVKYNVYMAQANKYAKKIKELQADLAKDPYNQDIANQLQKYIEAQQEAILNAEDMKNSIKDMVSDGIDKELDSLQKLIDKRNDALDAAKDLYDYQKKIKESTKDIADLEKQMAAYQGDVSEETKAKIQQIKVDLEEAKSDLEETEYEQYISDQQKMLDDLYNDYETILNQRLDDIDALMADMISEINNNASTIGATIESQADKVGYTLSESMNTIWLSGNGSISNVITAYGTKFDTALTTTNTALGYINTNIQNMIEQLNKIAGTKIKAAGASAATEKPKPAPSHAPAPQPQQVTVGGMINAGGARIYADSYGNGGGRQTFGSDPIYTVLQERNGYVLTRWHKLSSGYTGWFKKSDISAYALGAKNIRNNEMAWTQESGSEMIMRPSDGAILTPLAKNDSVLTSAASSNIWNMANNPSDFIKDNLDFDKIDTGANVGNKTTYTQNLDKVVFNLPNVKNYDELLKSMQHDKNFERLIMSMTIDPIVGKSSLAKGKAIR